MLGQIKGAIHSRFVSYLVWVGRWVNLKGWLIRCFKSVTQTTDTRKIDLQKQPTKWSKCLWNLGSQVIYHQNSPIDFGNLTNLPSKFTIFTYRFQASGLCFERPGGGWAVAEWESRELCGQPRKLGFFLPIKKYFMGKRYGIFPIFDFFDLLRILEFETQDLRFLNFGLPILLSQNRWLFLNLKESQDMCFTICHKLYQNRPRRLGRLEVGHLPQEHQGHWQGFAAGSMAAKRWINGPWPFWGMSFRDGKMCIHKAFRRFLSRVSRVIFLSTTGDWIERKCRSWGPISSDLN